MGQVISYNPADWTYMRELKSNLEFMMERNTDGKFSVAVAGVSRLFREAKREYLDS